MSSFQRKTIRVSITKPEGNPKFTASNKNTLILEGMRTSVSVNAQGGAVQPRADIKIYGLSEAIINKCACSSLMLAAVVSIPKTSVGCDKA